MRQTQRKNEPTIDLTSTFEVAAGSVPGHDHTAAGKNNQDAFAVSREYNTVTAVVCDGCSDGAHNEVGAHIAARLLPAIMHRHLHLLDEFGQNFSRFLHGVQVNALDALETILREMHGRLDAPGKYQDILQNNFLFTIVGLLMDQNLTTVFSIGDGFVAINGKAVRLGPFPNNQPPYLSYGLTKTSLDPKLLAFQVEAMVPTSEVQSVLIGTDGVVDLVAAENRNLPGRTENVGPLEQFWTNNQFFRNSDAVRRRLTLINRSSSRPDWENQVVKQECGLLPDDTTLVVVRRKAQDETIAQP